MHVDELSAFPMEFLKWLSHVGIDVFRVKPAFCDFGEGFDVIVVIRLGMSIFMEIRYQEVSATFRPSVDKASI